ncbi:hypothetical protein [Thiocapsa imhoffii]|nr:hypothetical protein [Thiocapsa imhoffii]
MRRDPARGMSETACRAPYPPYMGHRGRTTVIEGHREWTKVIAIGD